MHRWFACLLYPRIPAVYLLIVVVAGAIGVWAFLSDQEEVTPDEVSVEVQTWLPETEEVDRQLLNADLPDFSDYTDVAERKEAFFSFIYSFVEYENERILTEREEMAPIWRKLENGEADMLTAAERQTVSDHAEQYRIDSDEMSIKQLARELKRRMDVIPPSLVLAQAANESAWGTSRFAREANNLFGQWCFTQGCGLVPQRRRPGATHEVRSFDSVADAVHAYYRNINTHDAYDYLRELRFEMRQEDERLNSLVLAYGLTRYSERGTDYISELQGMIRFNDLRELDAQLQS